MDCAHIERCFLKRYGYEVKGFDIEEELVKEAEEKGCKCWIGDMRKEESYRGKYDVVVNWFTSFGYFSDRENRKVLENFYNALEDGGVLLLDLPARKPDSVSYYVQRREDDILEISEFVPENKHMVVRIKLYKEEHRVLKLLDELEVRVRQYSVGELTGMLNEVGFSEVYLFPTYLLHPWEGKGNRITFVGVK